MAVIDADRSISKSAGVSIAAIRRIALLAAAFAPAGAVLAFAAPSSVYVADPELGRLLRAMGLLKLAFAAPMIALAWVRLAAPISARLAAGYVAIPAVAAASIALIVSLSGVGFASLAFHASLVAFCVLAHRDKGFVDALRPLARRR